MILFVFARYSCQVTSHPTLYVILHETEFIQNVVMHYFQFGVTVQYQFIIFIWKSLNISWEEKEIVTVVIMSQISNPCSMSWHSCVNCSHSSPCTFLSLPKSTDMFYVPMPQNSNPSSWLQTICVSLVLSLSETFLIFHKLS
jgi:hypothetical protein